MHNFNTNFFFVQFIAVSRYLYFNFLFYIKLRIILLCTGAEIKRMSKTWRAYKGCGFLFIFLLANIISRAYSICTLRTMS